MFAHRNPLNRQLHACIVSIYLSSYDKLLKLCEIEPLSSNGVPARTQLDYNTTNYVSTHSISMFP